MRSAYGIGTGRERDGRLRAAYLNSIATLTFIALAIRQMLPRRRRHLAAASWPSAASADESESSDQFQVVSLAALVRMKLTSFRLKDRVHLLDMLDVG